MGFQVSPGVQVTEKDLTNVVPAVATSIAGIVMAAERGPVDQITAIASEEQLVSVFGEPQSDSNQFEDWMSAAAFLGYGNALRVVRPATGAVNACAENTAILIRNATHWKDGWTTGGATTGPYNDGSANIGEWAAKTAGAWGNSLKVSMCPSSAAFEEAAGDVANNALTAEEPAGETQIAVTSDDGFAVGDIVNFQEADGSEYKVTATGTNTITIERYGTANKEGGLRSTIATATTVRRRWEFYDQFDAAPGTSDYVKERTTVNSNDEMHVIVVDEDGLITGVPGTILEKFAGISKASNAKTSTGVDNYYPNVMFNQSNYIYWMDHRSGATNWGSSTSTVGTTVYTAVASAAQAPGGLSTISLTSGVDDYGITAGEKKDGLDRFKDSETVDLNLMICGKADGTYAGQAIDMCTDRKDAVAFISPESSDVVAVADEITQTSNVKGFFDGLTSSSYAVFDSGYKYTYDKYGDTYRWIPLNGDIAGLCARTDQVADPWFSPGGLNRGGIRGAVKLAYNPQKANRDILYRARINPVVTFPGQGTVLFGDKTGQTKPSAFDRINVRRLFITLEKAVATAAKFQLFEFNDEFTRAGFRNMVEPFLRDVQGRRGITDFLVVCDDTNNTGEVVDRNEFIADIFIKPARSINFISLNFVATRTGVSFSEVAGA